MSDPIALVVIGWVVAASLMTALWFWHRRLGNVGVVDVGWTASVALLAALYSVAAPGYAVRRWLVGALFVMWGARLAGHLLHDRVLGRPEDRRYVALRERNSIAAAAGFCPFFQAQALLAVVFSAPALIAAFNPTAQLQVHEFIASAIWTIGFWGEAAADAQLKAFKARSGNASRTCRDGLWRYSRHPNYFFEWLMWVAYALLAWSGPWGPVALICPGLMLYLLFRVTGIPETEAQAIRSKGDDYRDYQRTTSAFVPWKPRTDS